MFELFVTEFSLELLEKFYYNCCCCY